MIVTEDEQHQENTKDLDSEDGCGTKNVQSTLPWSPELPSNALGFWGSVMMLTTFETSGSIITMPYAMGVLGYIGGPLAMILWAALALIISYFLCDVALASKERCMTFGDVGFQLDGIRGRRLFNFMQLLNLVLYMPLALDTVALSVQYLSGYIFGRCIEYWLIIMFALLLLIQQFVRHWSHISWFAYFTVALAATKAFIFLPYAFKTYEAEIKESSYYLGPVQPFGSPGGSWYDYGLAMATFPYTFSPLFVLMEVMREMKRPETIKKSLSVASGFQLSFYAVAGLTGTALWGWNIEDPVTVQIPHGWVGGLLSAMVAIAVVVDYIVAGKIVSDAFRRAVVSRFFPSEIEQSWVGHLSATTPPSILALALVSLVPDFSTLVGVVTGFTIVSTSTWVVTLAWEMGKRAAVACRWLLHIATIVGIPLTIWVIVASIYTIAMADYNSGFLCRQGTLTPK